MIPTQVELEVVALYFYVIRYRYSAIKKGGFGRLGSMLTLFRSHTILQTILVFKWKPKQKIPVNDIIQLERK
jgi:hypothetical protein